MWRNAACSLLSAKCSIITRSLMAPANSRRELAVQTAPATNLATGPKTSYTWDDRNRLTEVETVTSRN